MGDGNVAEVRSPKSPTNSKISIGLHNETLNKNAEMESATFSKETPKRKTKR